LTGKKMLSLYRSKTDTKALRERRKRARSRDGLRGEGWQRGGKKSIDVPVMWIRKMSYPPFV